MGSSGTRTPHAHLRAAGLAAPPGTPLYVHVPFCAAKCTYCDFYSLAGEGQDLPGTLDRLLQEARARAPQRPRTVFLGGGTPSYYSAEDLERLLDGLDRLTGFRSSAEEVTCECNPESLDLAKARTLRALGVDRLSIGLQSLDPHILALFGRVHDVEAGFAALWAAREAGFEHVSVDLIYGVPGQDRAGWERDLARVLAERPDHVSAYQLTFEEGTPLAAQLASGAVTRLGEDEELAFYQGTHAQMAAAGYEGYEISNFCLQGHQCVHNINYWCNGPYVGIGPSAVSKLAHTRFGNPRSLMPWRDALTAGRFPAAWEETPGPEKRLGETWWLGLRMRRGVDPAEALRTAGFSGKDPTTGVRRGLEQAGLLEHREGRVRLSARGWPLADAVARQLLTACDRKGEPSAGEE